MKKRAFAGLLAVVLSMSLLAGCGGSNTGSTTQSNTGTTANDNNAAADTAAEDTGAADTAPAETTLSGDDVKLLFTFWGSPVEKQAVEDTMRAFEKVHPNVSVETQHIPNDYETKITTMIAANEAPDAGYLGGPTAIRWAQDGTIADLGAMIDADPNFSIDDFAANAFYRTMDGKIIGFNSALEMFAIFYNVDMFEEAGLPLPPQTAADAWTWDEMIEVAKKLTIDINGNTADSPNFDPANIQQYGFNHGTWWAQYMNSVYSVGGDIISADGSQFTLTEPAAVGALQKIADLMNVHHVSPTPTQRQNVPAPAIALQTKQVAMTIEGQWVLLDLADAKKNGGLNYGVAVLPKMQDYKSTFIGGATVLFSASDNLDYAYELLKFTSDPGAALGIFEGGLWMPLLREWYTDDSKFQQWAGENDAHPAGYDTVFKDIILDPNLTHRSLEYYVVNMNEVMAIIDPALDRAWLGEVSVQEALDSVKADVENVMGGRYPDK